MYSGVPKAGAPVFMSTFEVNVPITQGEPGATYWNRAIAESASAIDRVTAYETGLVGHHSFRGDECESDPLIMDERFLAAHVRGRGVSVLSACSHAGVVNACLGAMTAYPDTPIDVVLGGYHLAGKAMEVRINDTVRDLLERIDPSVLAPGHCTGWRAKAALSAAFAPGRYAPSVVGSRFHLIAR